MAWTAADLVAIEKSIKNGTSRVRYADREITYRDLDELLKLRTIIQAELGVIANGGITHHYPKFSKGIQ